MQSVHSILVAATVKTETLTASGDGSLNYVIVHMRDGGPIYFTVDGSVPTVGGDDTFVLHTSLPVRTIQIPTTNAVTVKLISASTDLYSVEAV